MTPWDLISALFYPVDEQLHALPKHPAAHLWPSEVGTVGLLHARKGGGNRAFHRWLTRAYRSVLPRLPERTRLFRLCKTHQDWTRAFLAAPTGLGGKLCLWLHQDGLVVGWDGATAHVPAHTLQWLIQQVDGRRMVLSDTGFHAAAGAPANRKLGQRGEWQDRMLVETVRSMLTLVCHGKKVMHRVWTYFHARLACTMAAFQVLVQWHGLQPNTSGVVPLSIAAFSL